jgi:hypothetical protein
MKTDYLRYADDPSPVQGVKITLALLGLLWLAMWAVYVWIH